MSVSDLGPFKLFGSVVRELRLAREITQEDLAIRCGVRRASINMIEKARRDPSPALLRSLCRGLALDQSELIRLLMAFVDQEHRVAYTISLMGRASAQFRRSIWIISDNLIELTPAGRVFLEAADQAFRSGHERVYFVPDEQQGRDLYAVFKAEVSNPATLAKSLKIIKTPEALCTLRIEIENPDDSRTTAGWLMADPVRLEQLQLSSSQVAALCYSLSRVLRRLGVDPHDESGGFSLIFDGMQFRTDIAKGL